MTLETAKQFFFWCSVINYGILGLWAILWLFLRDPLFRLQSAITGLPREPLEMLNVYAIAFYKCGIFLFNIVPCIACYLIK